MESGGWSWPGIGRGRTGGATGNGTTGGISSSGKPGETSGAATGEGGA
jgi:hypothetical protein